ncbi:hypothetical protein A3860_39450 [Niastella vici]|uniref:Protein CR006 P-loop domain-containing protein n=1 Tax=Niastella vici TaxID=1703345 RepID=A0A1V9FK24_9BACT|nr:AAA family ATPase [Niastella vici]OQP58708.1 hypothetical protein A3860_39450 [Niastella vici]
MITKINLDKVASYKYPTPLETDRKINLIYGLNGTGKSTLSNLLYKPNEQRFSNCFIEGLNDDDVLVYNQNFIQDNFFEPENQKGIFTLSKENKEAEVKIGQAEKEINKIEGEKGIKLKELEQEKVELNQKQESAKNNVWEIKKNYTGGDRVLEFCLDGLKSDGNKLLSYIESLQKPNTKPTKSIAELKDDVQALSGENAQKYAPLAFIVFASQDIEEEALLGKQIIGNKNTTVSELINKLGNSDWVKAGLKYLSSELTQENESCPFCQENTISKALITSINDYFDESYEADVSSLKACLVKYSEAVQLIPDKSFFENNPKFETYKKDFEIKYNAFVRIVDENKKLIEDKIKSPSVSVKLKSSIKALEELNSIIQSVNVLIGEHNKKIDHKESALREIKDTFWNLMRWDYDQTINTFILAKEASQKNIGLINKALSDLAAEMKKHKEIIIEQQKQTVNIEEAVMNINNGLIDLGIDDFKIEHYSDNLYKIVREGNAERIFRSLSEGEKMIISFLYFLELCRGKKDATEAAKKKIVVIDDPISSLSHIYVFNVGRLIKNEFFGKKEKNNGSVTWTYKYEQVFILTHSLYFFYEITETKHEERKETQRLFRLVKNDEGSKFIPMSYEEIQNDYQAYWFIIKDEKQPAALIANCMRNVIEYFFNFVEKKDLNNFFLQPSMQANRFQAFYRYINRESHSLGQNIFDYKEFNYTDFKDAFAALFKVAGYEAHYKKMMK